MTTFCSTRTAFGLPSTFFTARTAFGLSLTEASSLVVATLHEAPTSKFSLKDDVNKFDDLRGVELANFFLGDLLGPGLFKEILSLVVATLHAAPTSKFSLKDDVNKFDDLRGVELANFFRGDLLGPGLFREISTLFDCFVVTSSPEKENYLLS